jgi:hypothetical protein
MEQPGVGSLRGVMGEPGPDQIDVPVVWLPQEMWRSPYEPGAAPDPQPEAAEENTAEETTE